MATPEYLDGGAITYKSDIYSLGIIIMQIVTGRNKKDCSNTVLENWRSRLTLDTSMGDTSLETCYQQVKICFEIGMSCMDHDPGNRSTTQHIIHRLQKTDVIERSVTSDLDSSYLKQMILRSRAAFRPVVAESKSSPETIVAESKTSPATIVAESKASSAPTPINTTPHRILTKPKQNTSAVDPHRLTLFPRPASPSLTKKPTTISPATMPAADYQGSLSHSPFSSFGRSLLAMLPSGGEADLEAFQRHMADSLAELRDREGFLSLAWIRLLLKAFLRCQEEFRVVVAHAAQQQSGGWVRAERLVVEYHQRAVKALDVCNAARHSIGEMRRWGHLASIAATVLLVPGKIHEGQLCRARKALSDLLILLGDGAASHCNRSFGRNRPSPSYASSVFSSSSSTPFRSPSWSVSSSSSHLHSPSLSVSRTWSAARQLQAIGSGLAVPRSHEADLAWHVYAMGCMLHLVSWVLVAAIPYPDCGAALHAHHLPATPLHAAFPWAQPLLALQDRLREEGKRKDRNNSCGLLKEIHALEKCAQMLAEAIDSAPIPITGERETMVREAAAELAAVCTAMKEGLQPLERQVREVFHHIVCCRMEGLDSPLLNADRSIH